MEKFVRVTAVAAPLPLANVDTDMIIPARFMKALTRDGLGKHLFQELRYAGDDSERADFILNRPACRRAGILEAACEPGWHRRARAQSRCWAARRCHHNRA